MAFSALHGFRSESEVLLSEGCCRAVVTLLTKRSDVLGQQIWVIRAVRTVAARTAVSIFCGRMRRLLVELLLDPFMAGATQRAHRSSEKRRIGTGVGLVTRSAVIDRRFVTRASGRCGCCNVVTLGA